MAAGAETLPRIGRGNLCWRLAFAREWLAKLERADPWLVKRLGFTDEKKVCLYDSGHGRWVFADTDLMICEGASESPAITRGFLVLASRIGLCSHPMRPLCE